MFFGYLILSFIIYIFGGAEVVANFFNSTPSEVFWIGFIIAAIGSFITGK